ncbi:MAG: hypothetical protein UZ14_CFX002003215 [Chloroflexi bacterium OLB14]|nr:MAG: hypothetical protein UZ14_CFX002003215 [Chloroflexi bacterium OLB14]
MSQFVEFFNHPFFIVVGGMATISSILATIYTLYLIIKGIFPVWYRLGLGLSTREIAIFADTEFDSLKSLLVDSKIFQEKNITKIDSKSIKKAEKITLFLVHWKSFKDEFEEILRVKKDTSALIVYAPQDEGFIDKDVITKINLERNALIVNFRGRLVNDILTCMITTSYHKR